MAKAARAARSTARPERSRRGARSPRPAPRRTRPVRVTGTTENVDGRLACLGTLRRGQDRGAATLRGGGAVEEMEGVGDDARGQDVLGRERSAVVVDRIGVGVAVGTDHGRGGGQLLGCGAVGEHVTPRHERELGCGEQPVSDDELVGRSRPGRGGGTIHVNTGAAAAMSTTLHWRVVMRAAASSMAGIPIALGRLSRSSPSSRTICAQSVPTTPSTSRGEMRRRPMSHCPMRAMDDESCSRRRRACTVLWTPAMATPQSGCGEGRVMACSIGGRRHIVHGDILAWARRPAGSGPD